MKKKKVIITLSLITISIVVFLIIALFGKAKINSTAKWIKDNGGTYSATIPKWVPDFAVSAHKGLFGDNIVEVGINNEKLTDIEPLKNLSKLEFLTIQFTSVESLTPLSNNFNLEGLLLSDTLVKDLSPLASLDKLSVLDISNTPVEDLSPLYNLKSLKELTVSEYHFKDAQIKEFQKNIPNCKIIFNDQPSMRIDRL